jgi:CRP/FNR family transcriptional regulator
MQPPVAELPPNDPAFPAWVRRTLSPEDFDNQERDDLRVLRRFGAVEQHPTKTILFREGDPASALYIIEEGEVELFFARRGERRIMQVVGPGSSIGDLPVMLELPVYAYGAATRRQTRLLRFSIETIDALVDVNPQICFRLLRVVSRRLERAERRMLELSGRSAFEQIAQYLVREAHDQQSDAVTVTQRDIGASLALGRQSVSRVLGELEHLGVVARRRGQLQILDPERLAAISDPASAHR